MPKSHITSAPQDNEQALHDFLTAVDRSTQPDELWSRTQCFAESQDMPIVSWIHASAGTSGPPETRSTLPAEVCAPWSLGGLFRCDPMVPALSRNSSLLWGADIVQTFNPPNQLREFYANLDAKGARSMLVVRFPRVAAQSLGIGIMANAMQQPKFIKFIAKKRQMLSLALIYVDERMLELRRSMATAEYKLAPREAECLTWLARGQGSDGIADSMGITVHTVQLHLASAKKKLSARSREHALAIALRHRLIRP